MSGVGGFELFRQVWRVPVDRRPDVHRALVDLDLRPADDRPSGTYSYDGFEILIGADAERGHWYVTFPTEPRTRVMLGGTSGRRTFIELLEGVMDAERVTVGLRLDVDVLPGTSFEDAPDEDDLLRMAGALEQLYGHRIGVTLTVEQTS